LIKNKGEKMKKGIIWKIGFPILALASLSIAVTSSPKKEKYFDFEEKVLPPEEKAVILSFDSVDLKIVAESDFYECGHYSIIKKNLVQESGPITLDEKEVLVKEKYPIFLRCKGPKVVIRQQ
jgi:hypothetical protein